MTTEKKKIYLSELTADVNNGLKKDQLCEKYGLNKAQMTGVLKQAGLKIRKFHTPKFELVADDVADNVVADNVAAEAPDNQAVAADQF
jgi:hypothetical protein